MAEKIHRIPTGVPGLDKLIDGGIPKGSVVLVTGAPGTGKTILGIQYAGEGVKLGQRCSYICIEQSPDAIFQQASQFNIDLQSVNMVSSEEVRYGIGKKPEDLEEKGKLILEVVKRNKPDRVVLDSISPLQIDDGLKARLVVRKLIDGLRKTGATVVVTGEALSGDYPDAITPFLVDGVIVMKKQALGTEETRSIIVDKMRHTKIDGSVHSIEFTKTGLTVA
jgi:KaiC/GvpD/RAD55 family RecA-like ATPase